MTDLEQTLVHLMEEAAEVIQAASKCLRFGYDHTEPGYGNNRERLQEEINDFWAKVLLLEEHPWQT